MIYALSGTSQSRLSARVSVERQRRIYTLAQRRHIVTLVDRAVQEDGVSFNRAADNLQVSGHSVRRWRVALVALQDPTNPQVCNGAETHHRGPVGFLDDIQEELIAFVCDSFCTCAQDWAIEACILGEDRYCTFDVCLELPFREQSCSLCCNTHCSAPSR